MRMLEVKVNNSRTIRIDKDGKNLSVNGVASDYELIKKTSNSFIIIKATKIYQVEVLSKEDKVATLSINNRVCTIEVSNHMDKILEMLGMDTSQTTQVKEIKAPMPGSILNIMVEEEQDISSGAPILILEAMKMENVIKSSGDGRVSKIHVSEKENVEKNQVLVTFH